MDGLNIEFRGNPVEFMQTHILHPNPSWSIEGGILDQRDLQTGIHSFDILRPHGTAALYRLKFWERGALFLHQTKVPEGTFQRVTVAAHQPTLMEKVKGYFTDPRYHDDPNPRRSNEGPIKAYWLPFQMNRTFEMDLGAAANYFFTAGLSGCTVVVSGNPQAPHVAHINRMNGAELNAMIQKYNPSYAAPTKAETTQRQVMLQELQAVVAARNAGLGAPGKLPSLRGKNYGVRELNPWAVNPKGAVDVGGPSKGTGNLYFGVCDFEEHYKGPSEFDCLAQVTGHRNANTGNWRFFYQKLSSGANRAEAFYVVRGQLQCLICKTTPDKCVCPT
jgi:hypothetical protein